LPEERRLIEQALSPSAAVKPPIPNGDRVMTKEKRKTLIFFLGIPLIILLLMLISGIRILPTPASYRSADGPSTELIQTEGVFRPGGYIRFTLSPDVRSVNGLYKATIITYAVNSPNQSMDDALWPYERHDPHSKRWDDSLVGGSRSFTVSHTVNIPDDPSLAGRRILFILDYTISYPRKISETLFDTTRIVYEESIYVDLEDQLLTPEERSWKEQVQSQRQEWNIVDEIAGILIIFGGFYWLFYGLFPVIKMLIPRLKRK